MRSRSNRTRRGQRPDVTRLRVKEGDVLVVHFNQDDTSLHCAEEARRIVQSAVGDGVKVLTATKGISFTTIDCAK
jgi:aminoglycoside N3'-acetyltransferase